MFHANSFIHTKNFLDFDKETPSDLVVLVSDLTFSRGKIADLIIYDDTMHYTVFHDEFHQIKFAH